jgi:signal peptidase I
VAYDFVFRVVGLPNEKIAVNDDVVFVDGKPLSQRSGQKAYLDEVEETADGRRYLVRIAKELEPELAAFPETRVPVDHVFVMGDNRRGASDSRTSGPVPFAAIRARVFEW